LVPKKAMDELKSLLDATDSETIDFAKDESTLYFRVGQRLLTSRQLTGQFPNYEAVLPKDITKSISVPGEDLGAAISRVAQFADERSHAVRLRLEKDELKLSASSTDSGESEDSIEIAYSGDAGLKVLGYSNSVFANNVDGAGKCIHEAKFSRCDGNSYSANTPFSFPENCCIRAFRSVCIDGPASLNRRRHARIAAIFSGCRTKVPAKNVMPCTGYDSSPYCHWPPSSASRVNWDG